MSNVLRKMRRHSTLYQRRFRKPAYVKLNYWQRFQLEMMQTAFGAMLLKTLTRAGKTVGEIKHVILGDK